MSKVDYIPVTSSPSMAAKVAAAKSSAATPTGVMAALGVCLLLALLL